MTRTHPAHPVDASLANAAIFQSLALDDIALIRGCAHEDHFTAGTPIVCEGDPDRRFYVILHGEATVITHGRSAIHLTSGDHFGEIAALGGTTRTATIIAETDVHLLSISHFNLKALLREQPEIALGVIQGLCSIVRDGYSEHGPLAAEAENWVSAFPAPTAPNR